MKTRKIESQNRETDLTPLVNVVFLTLMLFMISLYFQQVSGVERVKLPSDGLARPPWIEPEQELVLNFGYRRSSGGRRRDEVPTILLDDRRIDATELSPELDRQQRAMKSQSGSDALTNVTVLIRADADVPAGRVQELVQKCRESGFVNFSLQAMPAEQ